jgi:hypothetical protein
MKTPTTNMPRYRIYDPRNPDHPYHEEWKRDQAMEDDSEMENEDTANRTNYPSDDGKIVGNRGAWSGRVSRIVE